MMQNLDGLIKDMVQKDCKIQLAVDLWCIF